LQVNTETRDYEEEKNADVTKRTRELDQARRILKQIVRKNVWSLYDGVINDDAQSGSAPKRVNATQAFPVRGNRGGIDHSGISLRLCGTFASLREKLFHAKAPRHTQRRKGYFKPKPVTARRYCTS
jgi:hypothetical protein